FLAIAGYSGAKLYENRVKRHNFAEKQKANSLVGAKIQEATFVMADPLPEIHIAPTVVATVDTTGRYHIVAGAFRVKQNAYNKRDQLLKKGYGARLMGANRYGLHQVVYNSYQNRSDALRELRELRRTENSSAWLLVK
ncbi:MAG: SPOR domain-containing protein, partial [Marinirhabdus sp.]